MATPSIRLAALLAALVAVTLGLASRADAYIYWNSGSNLDTIGRANLDGGGVQPNFIELPPFHYRCALAVDERYIYWTNSRQSTIGRANLDGTGVDESFIADANPGCGLAVDGSHVYWPTSTPSDGGTPFGRGVIARANLDGTDVDKGFITGLDFPSSVAVGPEHIYWVDGVPSGIPFYFPYTIGRADPDGTGVQRRFITELVGSAVAVDASHIYSSVTGESRGDEFVYRAVSRAKLDGTGVEVLIEGASGSALALDDAHIYWYYRGSIGRAKLDGTRANDDLITGITGGGELAVDELGPRPSNKFSFGKVRKNPKKGTARLTVKVPGSGELQLAKTRNVKGKQKGADAKGKVKLPIKPRRKAKTRLERRGTAKVKATVTYTPDGGEPKTRSKRVKLFKRR